MNAPLDSFNKTLRSLLPGNSTEQIVDYLRIYTHLIRATENLNPQQYRRAFQLVRIVYDRTRASTNKQEHRHMQGIRDITKQVLGLQSKIAKHLDQADPMHAVTKLQHAQNICVLRIIELSMNN